MRQPNCSSTIAHVKPPERVSRSTLRIIPHFLDNRLLACIGRRLSVGVTKHKIRKSTEIGSGRVDASPNQSQTLVIAELMGPWENVSVANFEAPGKAMFSSSFGK